MSDKSTIQSEIASNSSAHDSEFAIADRIAKILDQYDKPMRKKVLTLLNARENTRAVPFGIPVGVVQSPAPKPKGKGKPKAIAKAAWKSDPSVTAIADERKVILKRLKAIADKPEKDGVLKELRDCEKRLKDAKAKYRNSGSSGGSKKNQQVGSSSAETQ